jgi:toxin ParE1/3/4
MAFSIRIRPEAEKDLQEAFDYYQLCRVGLGHDFMMCVEVALESIQRNPAQHPNIHKQIHRNFVSRFPFGIYYLLKQDLVLVIAVLHVRRNPLHWQKRV